MVCQAGVVRLDGWTQRVRFVSLRFCFPPPLSFLAVCFALFVFFVSSFALCFVIIVALLDRQTAKRP